MENGYLKAPIRFITNRDLKGEPQNERDGVEWVEGQYALVPWIVVRNRKGLWGPEFPKEPPWVIGDFWDEAPREIPESLVQVHDTGKGLVLFKGDFTLPMHRPFVFDPKHPPQLLLSEKEVRAGSGYTLSIKEMPNSAVEIRYSIDSEAPLRFLVRLDANGDVQFDVSSYTRKGTYRMLAFRQADDPAWFGTEATIVVK